MLLDECNFCINQIENIIPFVRRQNLEIERAMMENFKLKAELYKNNGD